MVDILGKCVSGGGYLGQMCIIMVDILGKCCNNYMKLIITVERTRRKVSGFSKVVEGREGVGWG